MRILFVAMSASVHTARWIAQLAGRGWDLHLFPSIDLGATHPEMRDLTVHQSFYGGRAKPHPSVRQRGINLHNHPLSYVARRAAHQLLPRHRLHQLVRLVRRLRPDVIHSLEFQSGGYLTLEAAREIGNGFPAWIATNWGSDLYLFGRLPSHAARVRAVLERCDWYSCECERDVGLARSLGLRGQVLPVLPNGGGFDLDEAKGLRAGGRVSARRLIMLKGYQHFAGRALVGIRALERCADALAGYTVVVYSASEDVALAAERLAARTGIPVKLLPADTPRQEILAQHGQARIALGLSISDGISTSFLEAMMMGAFPVQSDTACACEWVRDGQDALLVPPEDPEQVEQALRKALSDDELVDRAAEANWATAEAKLDRKTIAPRAAAYYERVTAARRT